MTGTRYQTVGATDALTTEYLLGDQLPRIPRGDVTVFYGDGSVGKGRLNAWMIKQVTSTGGSVVGVWPEDDPHEQLRPRLDAAGLTEDELARVINLTRLPGSARFKISADLTHPGDMPYLRTEVLPELADMGHDVRMVILDPLAAVVGFGSIQSNAGARRAVEPFQDLCQDTGIAGVIVAHTTKAGILQGSAGLLQAVRLAYKISKDRSNPEIRVIHAEKANNLPPQEDLRFLLEDDGNGNARVVFLDNAYVESRQRAWRTTEYAAGMIIVRKHGTETRPFGKFTDLGEAMATCAAQPECAGPALEWSQHVNTDGVADIYTISADFKRDGIEYAFAIKSNKPLTASMAA